jgi:hypothetical protein
MAEVGSATASAVLQLPSTGASAATIACGCAAVVLYQGRFKYPALAVMVSVVAFTALTQRFDTSIAHLLAVALGTGIGLVWPYYRHGQLALPQVRTRSID